MKKIVLLILLGVILLPAAVFSASPTDLEVQETTSAVLSVFGIVFLNSMFGNVPDGIESSIGIQTGDSVITFNDFNPAVYFNEMAAEDGSSVDSEEIPEFYYKTMTGTISVDEDGYMTCDMKLSGGNINTLEFRSADENFEYFKVNGKPRSMIADLMP